MERIAWVEIRGYAKGGLESGSACENVGSRDCTWKSNLGDILGILCLRMGKFGVFCFERNGNEWWVKASQGANRREDCRGPVGFPAALRIVFVGFWLFMEGW